MFSDWMFHIDDRKGESDMADNSFAVEFFRIYDRKIMSGEISFSQTGISKEDFNRLCIDKEFVFSRDKLVQICEKMRLTSEETERLLSYAPEE